MKATTVVLMLALLLAACAPVANQRPLTAAERVELQRQEELRRERYCRTNFVHYREAKGAEGAGSFWGGYIIGYYESQCAGITVFSTRDKSGALMDATELRGWGLGLLQVAGLALFIAAWYFRELFIEKPGVVFGAALALVSGFMFLASAWHAEWVLAGVTAVIIVVGLRIVYAASPKQ